MHVELQKVVVRPADTHVLAEPSPYASNTTSLFLAIVASRRQQGFSAALSALHLVAFKRCQCLILDQ